MQSLHFEELLILSKVEKKARKIKLSDKVNIIFGENNVGKSTVIKSLYRSLGADTPQIDNNRWKKANPIYRVKFEVDGKLFYIVRDGKHFGFFDKDQQLLGKYFGISSAKGIGEKINKLVNFNIKLEDKQGNNKPLSPAFYFLPFYIDQDEGWNNSWSSFNGLQGIKDYRKNMIDYHLGIKPQSYYTALEESSRIGEINKEISSQRYSIEKILANYKSRKAIDNVDLNPENFRVELEELVDKYNAMYAQQQDKLEKIKKSRNEKRLYEQEIHLLQKSLREIEADYKFLERTDTPDCVECPTCGSEFENSVAERFGILDDFDYCKNLIDSKRKSLRDVDEELDGLVADYKKFSKDLEVIEDLMNRKKEAVTLYDIIRSEGHKEIISSINIDLENLSKTESENLKDLENLSDDLKIDRTTKKKIFEYYQSKMKESLDKLNVHVLEENDYKSPEKLIKSNALGSDRPRSLLAQYISLLHTMSKFNEFVVCPLIIDSPIQQEQDAPNSKSIFDFIFANALPNQQLILGTLKEYLANQVKEDWNIIDLNEKYGLLQANEYESVLTEINQMHELTLTV